MKQSLVSVGPCALDYTKMKTADHYWTDPPADELVQRHRIHSSGAHMRPDSPKRPGLQVNGCQNTTQVSIMLDIIKHRRVVIELSDFT